MSSNGLVLNGWPEQRGLAFVLQVEQTAPGNYLNVLIPCGASFNNPFSDFYFKKVPTNVISSQDSEQSEPLDLSHKPGAYQPADQNNNILSDQSKLRINQVWSMAGEASSHLYSINSHHLALTSTLKDTAGKSFSGLRKLTPKSLSVADIHHKPREISNPFPNNQNHVEPFSAPTLTVSIINPQLKLNSELLQRNTPPAGNGSDFTASASCSGESLTISHDKAYQKAYARSEKLRASKRAWEQSEKGRAWRIAYEQSGKGKAARKAYEQSEKGKAARKAYRLSIKRNAYLADKRKVSQAIRSAASIAYKSAIKKGFSLISRTQRRVIGNRNQNSFHGGFPLY